MKKTLVIAALIGGLFSAAAPLPVQAASSAMPAKCLILPLLQADCRDAIAGMMHHGAAVTAKAVVSTEKHAAAAVKMGTNKGMHMMMQTCTRAAAGSKRLYDCN